MKQVAGMKFKKVKNVTLPLFKIVPNGPHRYFRFEGEIFVGKKVEEKKDPAHLVHVIDLETGEEGQIIVPFLLESELNETYTSKGESYVGKCFEISILRDPAKKYNHVSITEIEVEDMAVTEHEATPHPHVIDTTKTMEEAVQEIEAIADDMREEHAGSTMHEFSEPALITDGEPEPEVQQERKRRR